MIGGERSRDHSAHLSLVQMTDESLESTRRMMNLCAEAKVMMMMMMMMMMIVMIMIIMMMVT